MKYTYITASLLALLPVAQTKAQVVNPAPRLVVNITIDQLRSDYLEAFSPLYNNNGFKKLLQDGTVYSICSYPFSPIDKASAIASIYTGTVPYYNGITGNKWLDKETLRPVDCENGTPENLCTSTICDELKISTGGSAKVYSVAPESEEAVFSAGHAADGAFWIDSNDGTWRTSPYYTKSKISWLTAFNDLNSTSTQYSTSRNKKSNSILNEKVKDMALQCIKSNGMGLDDITDILAVTYHAGNDKTSSVTGCQTDVQNVYTKLDRTIGDFISNIQSLIGKDHVLFVITSTGCSDDKTADYSKYRIPTGKFYINRTASLLNMYFCAIYGQGNYVETCFSNEIFLNNKLFDQKRVNFGEILDRAQEFLAQVSGVRNIFTYKDLLSSGNAMTEKIRNGYNNNHSGDIIIEVAPGWRLINEDNFDNQLSRANIIPFPIIIYGAGTKAEKINYPVTIDRIAPTIAKSIRIRAPNACQAEPLF